VSVANLVDGAVPAGSALPERYVLGDRLGAGAAGETYAARDRARDDACVVKIFAGGAAARREALAEFRGLETLAHPSVVRVRDVGRLPDGRLFLVSDRVAGPGIDTIAAISDDGRRRAALERAARELSDALAHLHGRGLVHGDVCPANVRLGDDGRAVLIDFGLSGPPVPGDGAARGTLGYAAPEALTGVRAPAADLFALGATLFEAFCGAPPFGRGLAAVERMLATPAPAASSVRPGLGEGWDRLFARLLAADPAARPPSARELLREVTRLAAGAETPTELDLGVPYPEGDPLEGIVVGRRAERAALRAVLDRLADGACPAAAISLVGPPGSGRRTLFEVVARDLAVAAAAGVVPGVALWRGTVDGLARELSALAPAAPAPPAEDAQRAAESRLARLAEALEARARAQPLCVWLDEGPDAAAFAAFWAGAPPSGRALVVVPCTAPLGRAFEQALALPPLAETEIGALIAAGTERPPSADAVAAIARVGQGNAAVTALLARRLIANLRARGPEAIAADPGTELDALLARAFAALPADAQALVLALALSDGDAAAMAELPEERAAAARAAARSAGWIAPSAAGQARLPSASHRRAALAGAPPPLRRRLAGRALERLDESDPRRPDALAAAGRGEEASSLLRRTAAAAAGGGDPARAALLYERAAALVAPQGLEPREMLTLGTGLGLLGRRDEAARALGAARAAAEDAATRVACAEREAWLRTRGGDLAGARGVLEGALADAAGDATLETELGARLGRLLVTAGRFREALAVVDPLAAADRAANTAARALGLEAAVLAHAYVGELDRARERLAQLEGLGVLGEGRRAYLAALVAQLAGEESGALEGYRRALETGSRDGDVHTVAAVALNLGGLLAEAGAYAEALAASERAVRELGRLGAGAELAAALVNAANLLVVVGDLPAARRALVRARGLVSDAQQTLALAPALFVEGDLACRAGDPRAAVPLYRAAAAAYLGGSQPHHAAAALAAAAVAAAEGARPEDGRRALAEAERAGDPEDADDLLRARGALALADGGGDEPLAALAAKVEAAARRARERGRRPRAWRFAALAARLGDRAGDAATAHRSRDLARTVLQEVTMSTPEHHRAGLGRDPEALWLAGADGGAAAGEGALAARALAAEGRLRRLLRINKRLNSELRLPRLLEMIVDTVIELTDAERGFLLLENDAGALEVKVARNIDQQTLDAAEFELSRSIARRAAAGGEPIVTIDAVGDERFSEAMSVSDLHLHSVLAVPLAIKGRVAGTIYVDHRLRKGAFDQEDVRLVLDFAEQAAIALENARLLAELRRRERQVDALNRRLELELAARREELAGAKQELRENREALAVRYDYRNIIGKTPRMLELFRQLDRITDTALPVVIAGESGTGKELVARAIHANGPRRDRPFVGENCAAIPETLLESTLFGYVRGAFTGAEHDTRGLFEIADTGTLFLDEVGEMSPAMQGKLLRVLQEGELRRVGSERMRKVDVRIVAASNRDLGRLVEEGKFRRDLYFRLNVAQIALPPLRDRRDDIPLMVEHFRAKGAAAAGRAPKPIDPAALARLVAYRWPGNVRELENEITRADALSGDRITVADLSPAVASSGDPGVLPTDPDNLELRPRVERLERSLLREALGRAGNNQTKAAEMLGLSRFGLQKKLKRYNFA